MQHHFVSHREKIPSLLQGPVSLYYLGNNLYLMLEEYETQKFCAGCSCLFKETVLDSAVVYFWYTVTIVYVKMGR
jgi:hypothetical protein